MNRLAFVKYLGIFIASASVMFIPSLACAIIFQESWMIKPFLMSMAVSLILGVILALLGKTSNSRLQPRDTLALVGVGWLVMGALGALPYLFSGRFTAVDAYFESMSGFSTTGASILTNIEILPYSLLFWRSFTHWLGGLGIVLLLIIVLPFLGAGGKLLYRSEMPGLDKSNLKPRIKDSAMILFKLYAGLTLLMTACLMLAGMDLYDALCHTFGALSTGGYSTRNTSIAFYESPLIEAIVMTFMFIAGTSFGLLYCVCRGQIGRLLKNSEWRLYLALLLFSTLFITLDLLWAGDSIPGYLGQDDNACPGAIDRFRMAIFQVVSTMTCTGFSTADFDQWPMFSKALLLVLMIIGGCSGSTSGGLKVMRILVLFKMVVWHLDRTFRPKNIRVMRVDDLTVTGEVQNSILTYFVLYMLIFGMVTLALTASGMSLVSSFSAVASCFNGVGPGLELVGAAKNYALVPAFGKVLLSLVMAMGRLEIYAICVLCMPGFWKKQ